jgi:hypothetical protein
MIGEKWQGSMHVVHQVVHQVAQRRASHAARPRAAAAAWQLPSYCLPAQAVQFTWLEAKGEGQVEEMQCTTRVG